MTESVSVRAATAADARAIQSVARASWHAAYDDLLGEETVAEYVDSWFDPESVIADDVEPPERDLFAATTGGDVVGFAETVPDDEEGVAHLYRIYVHPDVQGAGVGTSLLERAEAAVVADGVETFRVSVVGPNEDAVAFYEARGFERVDTVRDEQFGCDRYEYEKDVGAGV